MPKGKFVPETGEDLSQLSLSDLNQRITWAKWRSENAEKPAERKAAVTLLKRLEAVREQRQGIPSSHR